MSMVIANNMSAVNTKRQFATSARGMSGAMEKLSSGYKINTGKDDPSGLVISEKLRSQLNGLKRAQQNTEEGINVMGIAEGALNEMNSILKKMKALAIHSNNTGVTSPEQIAADQAEMDSAIQTLDRIAQTTRFSDENLLNGSKDIAFESTTAIKGTQQNSILNARETSFQQIFKRDDYAVAISFTGTTNADELTGTGDVDFSKQAMKAYMEVDTSKDESNTAQIENGRFTQDQAFTLTGVTGSRAFTFDQGETVATMVDQIHSAADSTGIDAALVFNSDQKINMTTSGEMGAPQTKVDFTIDGLNSAADTPMAFKLTASDALTAAMEGKSLTFRVVRNGAATYDLIANDGAKDITVASAWDGVGNNLGDAITRQINSAAAADVPLLDALSTQLTATGTINAGASTFSAINVYDGSKIENTLTEVASEIFKDQGGAGAMGGSIDMEVPADLNWEALYNRLSEADKAKFDAVVTAGDGFQIKATLTGDQGTPVMKIDLVNDNGGAVISSQNFALNIDAVAMAEDGFDDIDVDVGLFKGIKFTVNDVDKDGYGFDPATAVNGVVTPEATFTFDDTFVAGKVTKFTISDTATLANASYNKTGNLDTTAVDITFGGLKGAAAADAAGISIKVASDAHEDILADADTDGIEFKLVLEGGQKADNAGFEAETYSLTAKVGDTTYTLSRGFTLEGGTLGANITGGKLAVDAILASAGPGANTDVAAALAGLTIGAHSNAGNATVELNNSTGYQAADIYDAKMDKLTTTEITVADGIYDYDTEPGTAGVGKMEIKFDEFDLEAMAAIAPAGIDLDALATAIAGNNSSITAELVSKGAGDWELQLNMTDTTSSKILALGSFTKADLLAATDMPDGLDENGATQSTDDGWVTLGGAGSLKGLKVKISNTEDKALIGYQGTGNFEAGTMDGITDDSLIVKSNGSSTGASDVMAFAGASTASQTGGVAADGTAAREVGTVAIFNNQMKELDPKTHKTDGTVEKGVTGITFMVNDNGTPSDTSDDIATGANSIQLGKNTDGQGRLFVKFLDDNSYELYKDSTMSAESLVATGINGKELNQANNSGLEGITLNLAGTELTKVKGVYISLAGVEGTSTNDDPNPADSTPAMDGVSYNGDLVGSDPAKSLFEQDRTYISGIELGKNTDKDGKIYLKADYNHENGTVKISAYKDADMRAEDLVAESDVFSTDDVGSMTINLNEHRNADNTAGTGLGIVLSTSDAMFADLTKDQTFKSEITFNNLGARVFAKDYGSANYVKITQDKGSVFSYYGSAGQNTSKSMIEAGADGVTVQINGQDATLSINGSQVKTTGLELSMATQDIQASLVFNEGKVGSTTLAQVGYDAGSIFTKIGALNLSSKEAETEGKYVGLSGLLANAGHVTNETVDDFQGGMQLQLGEGAGDQNRTVVAIKSMTSENLGRINKGGYWDGDAIYSNRTFTMKDVFGGGVASLKQAPTLAMEIIEQSISDVSELRAQIGAVQTNMLQTNSNNLSVTMENIQKTESGIRDADMADEMTEFTKQQVLQNAAMSMMSQANQASQNVLQLLR